MSSDSADTFDISQQAGICVFALKGRVDSTNATSLTDGLTAHIQAGTRAILVDLREVRYLTSAAFRSLLMARKAAEGAGVRVALCGVIGHVRELFEIGGLIDVFKILDTREDGLAFLA